MMLEVSTFINRKRLLYKSVIIFSLFINNFIYGFNWTGTQTTNFTVANGDTFQSLRIQPLASSTVTVTFGAGAPCTWTGFDANSFIHVHTVDAASRVVFTIDKDVLLQSFDNLSKAVLEFSGLGQLFINITQGSTFQLGAMDRPVIFIIDMASTGLVRINKVNNGAAQTSNSVFQINGGTTPNGGSCVTFAKHAVVAPGNVVLELNGHSDNTLGVGGNNGVLLIKIQNGGGVVVEVIEKANNDVSNNTFADLTFTDALNGSPLIRCVNYSSPTAPTPILVSGSYNQFYSGVIIENNNSENLLLRSDIDSLGNFMYSGSPVGVLFDQPRSGFLLCDRGSLEIQDTCYCIYNAAENNKLPVYMDGSVSLALITKYRNPSAFCVDSTRSYETLVYDKTFLANSGNVFPPLGLENDLRPFKQNAPLIKLNGVSGLYFMSSRGISPLINSNQIGVTNAGGSSSGLDYLVPSYRQMEGILGFGNIAFINEGQCIIAGNGNANSVVNLLSTEIIPSGGSLFPNGTDTIFPLRTLNIEPADPFAKSLNQYGKSCMMFNDNLILRDITLLHTDLMHQVSASSELINSEPSYIGGDLYAFQQYFYEYGHGVYPEERNIYFRRPKLMFDNSDIVVANKRGIAFSGVDLTYTSAKRYNFSPSLDSNICNINFLADSTDDTKFFVLGSLYDATGNTNPSQAMDYSAHLDVMHYGLTTNPNIGNVGLFILSGKNNENILPNLNFLDSIALQNVNASFYLSHLSNISVGGNWNDNTDVPTINKIEVDTKYINFISDGGLFKSIQLAGPAAQNVISVAKYGQFVFRPYDAYGILSVPVIRDELSRPYSGDSLVASSIKDPMIVIPNYIGDARLVGFEDYLLNSNAPLLVGPDKSIFAYSYDPKGIVSGFNGFGLSTLRVFPMHYRAAFENIDPFTGLAAAFSGVNSTTVNLLNVPVIQGEIQRLVIRSNSIPALLAVDGGNINRVIIDTDTHDFNHDGDGDVVFILKNRGLVGLGNINTNNDISTIGNKGIRFIVDGEGIVNLNNDIYSYSTNQFMSVDDNVSSLVINSNNNSKIIVPRGQVFDLTGLAFGSTVSFYGDSELVLMPGAVVAIPAGVTLDFHNNSKLTFIRSKQSIGDISDKSFAYFVGGGIDIDGNPINGEIIFKDNSKMEIPVGCFANVSGFGSLNEAFDPLNLDSPIIVNQGSPATTSLLFEFQDNAQFIIGDKYSTFGGSFEIGNRSLSLSPVTVFAEIKFSSNRTRFVLGKQGFLGLGAGIVQKPESAPNNWTIKQLQNLGEIKFTLDRGLLEFNQIFSGDDLRASLIAFGYSDGITPGFPIYTISAFGETGSADSLFGEDLNTSLDIPVARLRGGSNFVALTSVGAGLSSVSVPVLATLGGVGANYLASVMPSSGHFIDRARFLFKKASNAMFNFLSPYDPTDINQNTVTSFDQGGASNVASLSFDEEEGILNFVDIQVDDLLNPVIRRKQYPRSFNFIKGFKVDLASLERALYQGGLNVAALKSALP